MVRKHVDDGHPGVHAVTDDFDAYASKVPVDDPVVLRQLMAKAGCILLDFDGPVCSVFAGWPAPEVAEWMRQQLAAEGIALNELARATGDPLEVLRQVAAGSVEGQRRGEELLQEAEAKCIPTAAPTLGAHDLLMKAANTGRSVAIVSNNSEPAIRAYLNLHGLKAFVKAVVGRLPEDASRMKPDPHLVDSALSNLGFHSENAIFIGDSISDIESASAARVSIVAYANRAGKLPLLSDARPRAIITALIQLTATM